MIERKININVPHYKFMRKLPLLTILLILVFSINTYAAGQATISYSKLTSGTPYNGEWVEYKGIVAVPGDLACSRTCVWDVGDSSGYVSDSGQSPSTLIDPGQQEEFKFKIKATGSGGQSQRTLMILCNKDFNLLQLCYDGTEDDPVYKQVTFQYGYNGDGSCTTNNNYESCLNAKSDCKCMSGKSCIDNKGDQNRGTDQKKCATYCGNGITEKQFETCSNCPTDVGKCDGASCSTANECEGSYCVHNVCSKLAYIKGDTYCDTSKGENCKNSGSDCACDSNERCSSSAVCETYCGNGVCESNEKGICKADCTWCGDGTCQSSESCSSCSEDCGNCKTTTKQTELKRNIGSNKESSDETKSYNQPGESFDAKTKKSMGVIGAIILLVIFIVAGNYLSKKKNKKRKKCTHCHKRIDLDSTHCYHCGHKIGSQKHNKHHKKNKK